MSDLISVLDDTLTAMNALKTEASTARDSIRTTDTQVSGMIDDTQKLFTALDPVSASAAIVKQITDGQSAIDDAAGQLGKSLDTLDAAVQDLKQKSEARIQADLDELTGLSTSLDQLGQQLGDLQQSTQTTMTQLTQRLTDALTQANQAMAGAVSYMTGDFVAPVQTDAQQISDHDSQLKTQVATLGDAMNAAVVKLQQAVSGLGEDLKGNLAGVGQAGQTSAEDAMAQLDTLGQSATSAPVQQLQQGTTTFVTQSQTDIGTRVTDLLTSNTQYTDAMTRCTPEFLKIEAIPTDLYAVVLKARIVKSIADARTCP